MFSKFQLRYLTIWKELSIFVRLNYIVFICVLSFGLLADSGAYLSWVRVIQTAIFMFIYALVCLEAIYAFEVSAVRMFEYQGDEIRKKRDRWLGKIVCRLLLVSGNVAVFYKIFFSSDG